MKLLLLYFFLTDYITHIIRSWNHGLILSSDRSPFVNCLGATIFHLLLLQPHQNMEVELDESFQVLIVLSKKY